MTTAAVVLAAGGGTRWQGESHKLLAVVRGRRVIDWAVGSALAAGLDDLIVVAGAVDLGIDGAVQNQRWAEGQATSLQRGLDVARGRGHDAIVVGLGDQPGVPADAWRAVSASDLPVATAVYGDVPGHPVRLHRSVWALLPTTGDEGARVLMRERPDLVVRVACEGDPADVDTVEDLRAWS